MPEKSKDIYNRLNNFFSCYYEEKDSIGKRYRRQDAIGTPLCITIDHETINNNTVTIRNRDTMKQERVSLDNLVKIIREQLDI